LHRRLSGDLDGIVLMALRKEPDRRYVSVEQFAEDIRRHLAGLPVIARRDSWKYRAGKFVIRHKLGVTASAIVLLVVLAGIAATVREARIAAANERRAEERFNDVRKLANSLMFELHDSIQDLPGATAARKLIVERALEYLDSLAQESRGDPSLQRELADAYKRIGDVQGGPFAANSGDTVAALKSYQKALAIRHALLASNQGNIDDSIGFAEVSRLAANALTVSGGTSTALDYTQRAVQLLDKALPAHPGNAKLMQELMRDCGAEADVLASSLIISNLGQLSSALPLRQKQLELATQLHAMDPGDPERQRTYASVLGVMGDQVLLQGQRHEALQYYLSAQETLQKLAADTNSIKLLLDLHDSYYRLIAVQMADGDAEKSAASARATVEIASKLSAADPANSQAFLLLAADYSYLADDTSRLGNKLKAHEIMAKAMAIDADLVRRYPGTPEFRHMHVSRLQVSGDIYRRHGDYRQALHSYEQALELLAAMEKEDPANGGTRMRKANACNGAAFSLTGLGDFAGASRRFHEAIDLTSIDMKSESSGEDALYAAADAYAGLAEMEALLAQTSAITRGRSNHWQQAIAWSNLALERWRQIKEPGLVSPNGFDCVPLSVVTARRSRYASAVAAGQSRPAGSEPSPALALPEGR
jgi:non-specific serine/threonine protein kinase/serine/threonine-protein kinase